MRKGVLKREKSRKFKVDWAKRKYVIKWPKNKSIIFLH